MNSRSRVLYIAPQSPVPGSKSLTKDTSTARVAGTARGGHGHGHGTARGRVCDAAARGSGDARTQRRAHGTGARTDQRRHTTASVAMTKRPGTRARSASQPPESPRPSAISHDSGVNKPATLLLLTQ